MLDPTAACAWDEPSLPLAPEVWCGTSLCLPPNLGDDASYGAYNLALHVGDNVGSVLNNRQRLQADLQVRITQPTNKDMGSIQWLDQVHGCAVVEASASTTSQVPTADAVWTQAPGLPIAVLTADCLPVVLAARDASCIGVAHGGWRGLVGGVLPALVAAMPVVPDNLVAWGGPGISVASYEVGRDVADAVAELTGAQAALLPGVGVGKFQLDLHRLAQISLASVGVMAYEASGRCAYQDNACYSYRRVGGNATGRMATIGLLCR